MESPSLHLISGMPGSGKTALGFSIADRIHAKTGKPLYVATTQGQEGLPASVPPWIQPFDGPDYPLDSIVLLDDAHLSAHARKAMSNFNVEFDKLHGTLRHDDIDYILDTQTLKAIDVNNILRSNYRWYKKPYTLDLLLGRPEIRKELEESATPELKKTEAYLSAETYGYWFQGRVTGIPLPPYWTPELSVMHRRREGLTNYIRRRIF